MYKYKYRYRENTGTTRKSLESVEKHIEKVGQINYIRAYVYKNDGICRPVVLVKGDRGSARFSGFSWGYNGEGVRGTKSLLQKLNIPSDTIDQVLSTKWTDEIKEHWRVKVA